MALIADLIYPGPLVSMILVLLILFWMLNAKLGHLVMDHPNDRSLHSVSVPRTGGLAIMTGIMIGWGFLWQSWLLPVLGCVLLLMLLSFLDDLYGLSAGWRLLAHMEITSMFLINGLSHSISWQYLFLILMATVWMINLYNFMDGSDGLAGGMAMFGFGTYAGVSWLAGDTAMAGVALCVAGAALSFLRFNFYPARIFMGDVGSIPLGFLSAAFGLLGWQRGNWPVWFPVLVFSPFIVDATVTLLKRLLRREEIWQAHRSHYYQRLVQMGWGHRKTALWGYVVMMLAGGSAVWMLGQSQVIQYMGLAGWLLVYLIMLLNIDRMWMNQAR